MPLMFNTLLQSAGLNPRDVRLMKHKDTRASRGRSPYELWRDKRELFESYQSTQNLGRRKELAAPYWASFIVNLSGETMFAGIYRVDYAGVLDHDRPAPHVEGGVEKAGDYDIYKLALDDRLSDLIGKLFIDWGPGTLAWIQYAERNEKPVLEIRPEFKEPGFPGFLKLIEPLSRVEKFPKTWVAALSATRGVYLLTCPRTKEQYVGKADGESGFWGRWQEYIQTGHGGNVALKSRDPSDYQVSILEVAGTSATPLEILTMEDRWKRKLQSREMGLNRN